MKCIAACCICMLIISPLSAQMPDDGFRMKKGELCVVMGYGQSKWDEYWEGKRLRNNLNLGTFTSKMIMPMLGYGITSKLTAFASLPHIDNSSDAGTMIGKKGWQDLTLALKYLALRKQLGKLDLSLFAQGEVSTPVNDYAPDFLPFSIGLGAKTATLGIVAHGELSKHWFATVHSAYVMKGKIKVDRSTYYTDQQFYSNEMAVSDVYLNSLRLGFKNEKFRADVHIKHHQSTTGTDIRRNDMPYPGNQMNMTSVGFAALVWVPKVEGLGVNFGFDQVISGRNVGKAFMWMVSVQYVFTPFNKKSEK